jgi:hypothetical protein
MLLATKSSQGAVAVQQISGLGMGIILDALLCCTATDPTLSRNQTAQQSWQILDEIDVRADLYYGVVNNTD